MHRSIERNLKVFQKIKYLGGFEWTKKFYSQYFYYWLQ